MQTFLPYPDFYQSALALDFRRLGKQRVENLQIMTALLGVKVGNTGRQESTGKFRTAYFDNDDEELSMEEVEELSVVGGLKNYISRQVEEFRYVPNSEDQWTIEHVPDPGWRNHPVTQMWRGYEVALLEYQKEICRVWTQHFGYEDTCLAKTAFLVRHLYPHDEEPIFPPWFGNERFHISHQSNLIRKDPEHYAHQFPGVPDTIPYFYPTQEG